MDITLGNIISWIVMVGGMGMIWGSLSETVQINSRANDRQDQTINIVQNSITDLKVAIAEGNGELRTMREILQNIQRTAFNNGETQTNKRRAATP